jgi:saccharopine dehydrogenase-like NADP-dependent oxidoreductase
VATRVLVLGAGHIGRVVAHLLTTAEGEPQYDVTLADRAFDRHVSARFGDRCRTVDGDDVDAFARLIGAHDLVVNALPFHFGATVARAAAPTTST